MLVDDPQRSLRRGVFRHRPGNGSHVAVLAGDPAHGVRPFLPLAVIGEDENTLGILELVTGCAQKGTGPVQGRPRGFVGSHLHVLERTAFHRTRLQLERLRLVEVHIRDGMAEIAGDPLP